MTDPRLASQMVAWWSVHEYVTPLLERVGSWPMAGSPGWCLLDDDDPIKLAALFEFAQHHALRIETAQQAKCEASRAISDAADWSAIAKYVRDQREFYEGHPWMRRRKTTS